MSDWTIGTDTSHWSGDIDFSKMYAAGARFWITKATDANKTSGVQFEDSAFNGYCEYVFDFGKLLTGCYHWLQYSVDPMVAADFYLERYNRFDFDFPPVLDFEEPSVTNFSDYAWRAQVWCRRVEEKTGRKPIIYTAKWFTSRFKTAQLLWMADYPLWVADYSWYSNNVKKAPYYMPSNIWDDWAIWQYTGSGDGHKYGTSSAAADLNYYQGDYSQLLEFIGKSESQPEPTDAEKLALLWAAHPELH
jgi:GH25 family lysozyme M1 (1,4-beta-N-acetylmuramidase)